MRSLVCIPDKILIKWLGKKKYIMPSDEGEGIGICAGIYLATGEPATMAMSADGLCNALNPLTSYVIPSGMKMNLVISTGRTEDQHKVMTNALYKILKAIKYDPERINITIIPKE